MLTRHQLNIHMTAKRSPEGAALAAVVNSTTHKVYMPSAFHREAMSARRKSPRRQNSSENTHFCMYYNALPDKPKLPDNWREQVRSASYEQIEPFPFIVVYEWARCYPDVAKTLPFRDLVHWVYRQRTTKDAPREPFPERVLALARPPSKFPWEVVEGWVSRKQEWRRLKDCWEQFKATQTGAMASSSSLVGL